jgi:hypothetical protein
LDAFPRAAAADELSLVIRVTNASRTVHQAHTAYQFEAERLGRPGDSLDVRFSGRLPAVFHGRDRPIA